MESMIEGQEEEIVEQDTSEIEDIPISNIIQFLSPDIDILTQSSSFGLHYNREIFQGWVKQPSACCGAASVAGAWNALAGLKRNDKLALAHTDILRIYESLFVDAIKKKSSSIERKMGAETGSIEIFIRDELSKELNTHGKVLGGKKGFGATKKYVMLSIKSLARQHLDKTSLTSTSASTSTSSSLQESKEEVTKNDEIKSKLYPATIIECILELFEMEGISVFPVKKAEGKEDNDEANNNGENNNAEGDSDADSDCDEIEEKESKATVAGSGSGWDWRKDLMDVIKNVSGLIKLRAKKPSTAPIGNWAILQGVQRLSEWTSLGTCIQSRLFMGKKRNPKQKLDVALSKRDSDEVITSQWDALRAQFTHKDTVLLFHLKNHYALIFALREWETHENSNTSTSSTSSATSQSQLQLQSPSPSPELRPKVVRQMLTARRGQRPTAWIDFDEARDVMIGWEGYKILAIQRTVEKHTMKDYKWEIPISY